MYEYKLSDIKVIDGDTIDATIDLGFSIQIRERIRLYGIDTPETRTRDLEEKKRGFAAKDRLEELIDDSVEPIIVQTTYDQRGKFGRVIGTLYSHIYQNLPDNSIWDPIVPVKSNINFQLISEGHAVEYMK
jgi:micrococcal nuclease|tara:strand:- start:1758 stop:2150 length:393 start_codon:yes stop_codon:yes gene_type:complete